MDFLKKFQNVENYTNFVNSDYFKLPNVSLTDEDYDVHYTNFISQGGEEEEETEPAVTLTYNVTIPNERVAFWNGGENIKRLYVDGEEISFDPVEITSETTEILGSTFDFGDMATFPDSCFLTSVPSRITLAPKDSSVQINKDIVFSFIKRDLLDDNYYTDIEFSDFIAYAGIGNIIDNKLVIDNQNFLSYINDLINDNYAVTFALTNGYSSAPVSLEADVDTVSAEPEMQVLDIIMTAEVITGGVPTPFLFDYPGQHTVKMVLNDTDFGGYGMFSYYADEVQEGSLLTNSSANYCTLQSVVINDKVTSILPGTFYQSSLYKVKIGSNVTSIGEEAFFENNIETVIIPDSVTRIDNYAFQYCYRLTSIEIGSGVTSIGSNAFYNCSGLTSVEIGSGCTSIDHSAFSGCKGLTNAEIGSGVTSIGDYAFQECSSLTGELVIPDSVTSIGNYVFQNCSGLKTVVIPDSVTSIGYSVFYNCSGLKTVVIPDSVTSINSSTFYGCTNLSSIVIPDSVTYIDDRAFYYCYRLTSIEIGSGVTSIGSNAFYNCYELAEITCHATTAPSIYSNTFYYVKSNGTLYVPSGSDYSSWMNTNYSYLGYYNWTQQSIS